MTDLLWTSAEAVAATGGKASKAFSATGVSIDTRNLTPGDLFVALTGPNRDGHEFVADALAKGAAAAMVSRVPANIPDGAPLLVLPDTQIGLEALAIAARARSDARIVAVTGSVGKTGTKEALRHVLSAQGRTHASMASHNNHWGVPLTLARLPRDAAYLVAEIGMNHAGEIRPLSLAVNPHVAVVTTVEPVHLEFFDSIEGIADAKAEIFEGLAPSGVAVLNRDNPHYARLADAARRAGADRVLGFGASSESEICVLKLRADAMGSDLYVDVLGHRINYRVGQPGRHIALNSLAVLGAAAALGADVEQAAAALKNLPAVSGRGARDRVETETGAFDLVDESYNASPPSLRAALSLLGMAAGRRIAVLGDMRELGAEADALHAALAPDVLRAGVALVFAAGTHMKKLYDALPDAVKGAWAPTSEELLPHVLAAVGGGDVVMVKGSNGSRMQPIVAALRAKGTQEGNA